MSGTVQDVSAHLKSTWLLRALRTDLTQYPATARVPLILSVTCVTSITVL